MRDFVPETLIESLTDVSAQLKTMAEGKIEISKEHLDYLAEIVDDYAKIAAITNMQKEELEKKVLEMEDQLEFYHGIYEGKA